MDDMHPNAGPFAVGGQAVAEEGLVFLDGPDGIAIAMTPDAAAETGRSLVAAAEEARRQEPPASR